MLTLHLTFQGGPLQINALLRKTALSAARCRGSDIQPMCVIVLSNTMWCLSAGLTSLSPCSTDSRVGCVMYCMLAGDENETQSQPPPGPVLHVGTGIPLLFFREDQLTRLGPQIM